MENASIVAGDLPPIPAPPRRSRLGRVLSWLAVAAPVVVTVPWVIILSPLKLAEDVFSIPGALAAAGLLTLVFAAVKRKHLPKRWIILPVLCWAYECAPITLPGPVDELLAIGGSGMVAVWAWAAKTHLPGK